MIEILEEYYCETGSERVGIVLADGEVLELRNTSEHPEQGFMLDDEDLLLLDEAETAGTWHTHPGTTSNLSVNDVEAFLAWPRLDHYVVGSDGVARYFVQDGCVLRDE